MRVTVGQSGATLICPYKSAILNFNVASFVYLKIDRSAHSISFISMDIWLCDLLCYEQHIS